MIFEMLLLQHFSSDFNQTSYKVSYKSGGDIDYYFSGNLPKIKLLWHFEIFLNTELYIYIFSWKFQSAISPTSFTGVHPNFVMFMRTLAGTLVTMVNLNAC